MFIEEAIPDKIIAASASTSQRGYGAHTLFIGRIRPDQKDNKSLKGIEFSSKLEIAENITMDIIAEGKEKFGILSAEVWHSLGMVHVGEACFLVSVHGKHRSESYKGLEYIVNEFKHRSPIFGKEIFDDGSHTWKKNQH